MTLLPPPSTRMTTPNLTDEQNEVLLAAVDLVTGGMDMEEVFHAYSTIAKYVINHPPTNNAHSNSCSHHS